MELCWMKYYQDEIGMKNDVIHIGMKNHRQQLYFSSPKSMHLPLLVVSLVFASKDILELVYFNSLFHRRLMAMKQVHNQGTLEYNLKTTKQNELLL